jgi:CRP/FNR family transcriptional regulator
MVPSHLVARIHLFEGLNEEQIARLAANCAQKSAQRGQTIFLAGDEADGFYAVLQGKVRIFRSAPSGKEHILHVLGPGEAFGEAAVFQGLQFPANAEAMEDSEILFFPRKAFVDQLTSDPEAAMRMLALLSLRLRGFVKKIEELSLKEAPARLAGHLLLLHSAQKTKELTLDLPKGQVASYLGVLPETLSRAFKRLADAGAVEVRGSRVLILDEKTLQRIAVGEG